MFVNRHGLRTMYELPRMSVIERLSLAGELTPRELLCLVAVDAGFSNRRLAQAIGVHKSTIGRQIRSARKRAAAIVGDAPSRDP
jgi:DNA-binding NarL/FixJ family response regulator